MTSQKSTLELDKDVGKRDFFSELWTCIVDMRYCTDMTKHCCDFYLPLIQSLSKNIGSAGIQHGTPKKNQGNKPSDHMRIHINADFKIYASTIGV